MREQITITREEIRKKIMENPRGYGLVRFMREHSENVDDERGFKLLIENLTLIMILHEIEQDLFGEEQTEEAEPAVQDLPFC